METENSGFWSAYEFSVVRLRLIPIAKSLELCDAPKSAADYWAKHVQNIHGYNADREHAVVLLLDACNRVRGHQMIGIGTLDSVLIHPRETLKLAILIGAPAVLLMHNHPSGDTTPSESDIRVTREIAHASRLLNIKLLDHVIIGESEFSSLRELGHVEA